MTANLIPIAKQQYWDSNGNPLVGGKVYTYQAGTSTPQATYTDSSGSTPNANPVILDSRGEAAIYWGSTAYKIVLQDASGNTIWTQDNVLDPAGTLKNLMSGANGSANVGFTPSGTGAVVRTVQSKLQEFVSIKDWGAVCDGSTNDTSAIQAAITGIGSAAVTLLVPGPTKIASNLTFGAGTELQFSAGGYFTGTSGSEVLQVQRQIVAGPHTCFSNCAPIATVGMTVYPEWFGAVADGSTDDKAAIQKAIDFLKNTGGTVQFDARTYAMSSNVNIGTGLAGSTGQNTVLQGKGANATKLQTTGAAVSAIQVLGASGTPLQGVMIRDLSITKSVTGTGGYGIYAQYTALLKIRDVAVSGYLIGVGLQRATNTLADKVVVTFSGATTNWRGFNLDGGGTGSGGNASSVFRDCYVDGTGASGTGSIGFYAYGAYVSDLLFDACETTTVGIGYEFDFSGASASGNEDVQLLNCRSDQIISYGIYATGGATDSMLSVIGGWFNGKNTAAETDSILLNAMRGVTINGVQFYNDTNYANGYHVKMTGGCNDVTITGCLFTGMKYGVYMVGTGYSVINGNRFWCQSGRTATNFIVGTGCARVMVNNNVFDGYCTNAVNFDGASSGCGIVGNTANITNITTRFTNNSTGPIGAADGSTGLNSGV
jgi:hypothetical protein